MRDRILVVDDEQVVLDAVGRALRHDDFDLAIARSGAEALALLAGSACRLLITDLVMPAMNGLELLARVRDLGMNMPALVITGYPTIQTVLRAKRLGAFEYVTKPFTKQELRSAIVRALRSAEAPSPAASGAPGVTTFYIPDHSWARLDPDGTARIGMAAAFARGIGEVAGLELPAKDDALEQGRVCVRVHAADGVEHSLYSPLSGWIVEVNNAVLEIPQLAGGDPEGTGWLLRIMPQNTEKELPNLAAR